MSFIAAPGCCEICASSRCRRSDDESVYVSFQRTPDDIMRMSRTETPSYALPESAVTYFVTGSESEVMRCCATAAPTSVDVIDFATDIDIHRVFSVLPYRYRSSAMRPLFSTRMPETRFRSRYCSRS